MILEIEELNEAYTLSKSLRSFITIMMDIADQENEENIAAFYGLIHLCESVIKNQSDAIDKISKIKI